jgi:predicted tellurium resistance membrane protein TerC
MVSIVRFLKWWFQQRLNITLTKQLLWQQFRSIENLDFALSLDSVVF